jgi:glucose/mannose-6-phosphate isomerase
VIGVPSGLQPRAAVAYTTVGALECVAACGAGDPPAEEVRAAGRLLETLIEEWGPDAPEGSEAKAIARGLEGALPVVYGAGATVAAARRWKSQLNENAKLPAFASVLPEADHNELIGYERARGLAPLHAVFLGDEGQRPELRRRLELTAEVVEATRAAGVTRVEARGDTALERLLSLVLLGDLVSVYLAVLAGVDPTSVLALESFKERLAEP